MLAVELTDIEREKFDRSLAKRQIRQHFPSQLRYMVRMYIYTTTYISRAWVDLGKNVWGGKPYLLWNGCSGHKSYSVKCFTSTTAKNFINDFSIVS